MDYSSLIKTTEAYRSIRAEKHSGRLSHAYLFVSADENSIDYLKVFAKLLCCDELDPCGYCRTCKLIDEQNHADVIFYPKNKESVVTEDINSLIEESYVKAYEGSKKIFIINNADTMNASAQNKLLKTLEEPPKNVHIMLMAKSLSPLLPTVLSRVKRFEIPAFSPERLFEALKDDYPDGQKLRTAIALGNGTVSLAQKYYSDDKVLEVENLVADMLVNMKSSRDILSYAVKVNNLKDRLNDFIWVLEIALRDLLTAKSGRENLVQNRGLYNKIKNAEGFSTGALVYALDGISEVNKRRKFNANQTMVNEWLLFKILEGKHKWQKL